jgi:hypothetical protein
LFCRKETQSLVPNHTSFYIPSHFRFWQKNLQLSCGRIVNGTTICELTLPFLLVSSVAFSMEQNIMITSMTLYYFRELTIFFCELTNSAKTNHHEDQYSLHLVAIGFRGHRRRSSQVATNHSAPARKHDHRHVYQPTSH